MYRDKTVMGLLRERWGNAGFFFIGEIIRKSLTLLGASNLATRGAAGECRDSSDLRQEKGGALLLSQRLFDSSDYASKNPDEFFSSSWF
jgi:hypothetical protein